MEQGALKLAVDFEEEEVRFWREVDDFVDKVRGPREEAAAVPDICW